MSWGYFTDLDITLSDASWAALLRQSPADVGLAPDWSGLEEPSLSAAFASPSTLGLRDTFETALAWPVFHGETVHRVESEDGRVHARVALLLDKSQLELAGVLGALFEAARLQGAEGTLTIVNDGTYSGESGCVHTIRDGERTLEGIDDCWPYVESIGAALYGDLEELD